MTKVIWITEQQPGPFREVLEAAALQDRGDELLILFRGDVIGRPWADVIRDVTRDALAGGYGLVIVDTLGKLAGVQDENSAAEWARAMDPLQAAAHAGLAVWVARHDRKSGGEVGESGRGSSQVSGDVDIILRLGKPEGRHPSTFRAIDALSRYRVTPERLIVELTDSGYVAHSDKAAVALAACVEAILTELSPHGSDVRSQTERELVTAVGHPRMTVRRAIDDLVLDGRLARNGSGKRGDPFRYSSITDQTPYPYLEGPVTNGAEPVDLMAEARRIFADDLVNPEPAA